MFKINNIKLLFAICQEWKADSHLIYFHYLCRLNVFEYLSLQVCVCLCISLSVDANTNPLPTTF